MSHTTDLFCLSLSFSLYSTRLGEFRQFALIHNAIRMFGFFFFDSFFFFSISFHILLIEKKFTRIAHKCIIFWSKYSNQIESISFNDNIRHIFVDSLEWRVLGDEYIARVILISRLKQFAVCNAKNVLPTDSGFMQLNTMTSFVSFHHVRFSEPCWNQESVILLHSFHEMSPFSQVVVLPNLLF